MHACMHNINSRNNRAHTQGAKSPFAVGSGKSSWFGRMLQAPACDRERIVHFEREGIVHFELRV